MTDNKQANKGGLGGQWHEWDYKPVSYAPEIHRKLRELRGWPSVHQNVLIGLPGDAALRKNLPIVTGVLDYFPAALLAVASVSLAGNKQHNQGEGLHWSRGKSSDHADAAVRHLLERGTNDSDGIRHTAKAAWRILALLQTELEEQAGFKP